LYFQIINTSKGLLGNKSFSSTVEPVKGKEPEKLVYKNEEITKMLVESSDFDEYSKRLVDKRIFIFFKFLENESGYSSSINDYTKYLFLISYSKKHYEEHIKYSEEYSKAVTLPSWVGVSRAEDVLAFSDKFLSESSSFSNSLKKVNDEKKKAQEAYLKAIKDCRDKTDVLYSNLCENSFLVAIDRLTVRCLDISVFVHASTLTDKDTKAEYFASKLKEKKKALFEEFKLIDVKDTEGCKAFSTKLKKYLALM